MRRGRLERFGRGGAARGQRDRRGCRRGAGEPAFADSPDGIVTMRNVLPDWAVRLLVGTLLLPAFLTALDALLPRPPPAARRPAVAGVAARHRLPGRDGVAVGARRSASPARSTRRTRRCCRCRRSSAPAGSRSASVAARVRDRLVRRAGADPRARGRARRARWPAAWPAATGAVLCVLAALVWVGQPVRRGAAAARRAPVAVRRRAADAAARLGRRGRRRRRAAAVRHRRRCTTRWRSQLDPLDELWMAVLAAAVRAALDRASRSSAAAMLACLAGAAGRDAHAPARRRPRPSPSRCARAARSRYAGPGSLGGTESALRR